MMMSGRVGAVADKIMQLLSNSDGPVSVREVHKELTEPIGLIHLGISQLVSEGRVDVVSWGKSNYITTPVKVSPVTVPRFVFTCEERVVAA